MTAWGKSLILSIALTTLFSTGSYAATPGDIEETLTINRTTVPIASGSVLEVEVALKNVGGTSIGPRGATYFLLPPNIAFSSLTNAPSNFSCTNYAYSVKDEFDFHAKYDDYALLTCGSTQNDFLNSLSPGESVTFDFELNVSSEFSRTDQPIVGFNLGNPDESDYSSLTYDIQNAAQYFGDPAEISSNNVDSHSFTSAPSNTQPSTQNTTPKSGGKTAVEGISQANGSPSGVQASTQSSPESVVEDKAEIALRDSRSIPPRINTGKGNSLQALLSGEYKYQLIIFGSVLGLLFVFVTYLINKHRKATRLQKEYRKSLDLMSRK